jgi:hypothetical protein
LLKIAISARTEPGRSMSASSFDFTQDERFSVYRTEVELITRTAPFLILSNQFAAAPPLSPPENARIAEFLLQQIPVYRARSQRRDRGKTAPKFLLKPFHRTLMLDDPPVVINSRGGQSSPQSHQPRPPLMFLFQQRDPLRFHSVGSEYSFEQA